MAQLHHSLLAYGTSDFEKVLADEIAGLSVRELPLQQGLAASSMALDDNINVVVLASSDLGNEIQVNASLFYDGIIAGCNCADDPTPIDRQPEHCTISITLDKVTAEALIQLIDQ